jgi:serine/threonine protein phosphatase PrpC
VSTSDPAKRRIVARGAAVSERGLRERNEDRCAAESLPGGAFLAVVADGLGGMSAGDAAADPAMCTLLDGARP